jgi:hypothetical protein
VTHSEYLSFYLDMRLGALGGNHAYFEITDPSGNKVATALRQRSGLMVLVLVSIIESNFLSKAQLRLLRNFEAPQMLPSSVDPLHLSCYIYIRDCVAHNPKRVMLPPGRNTDRFLSAVTSGAFPFARVTHSEVTVEDSHELHRIILRLFGQNV